MTMNKIVVQMTPDKESFVQMCKPVWTLKKMEWSRLSVSIHNGTKIIFPPFFVCFVDGTSVKVNNVTWSFEKWNGSFDTY